MPNHTEDDSKPNLIPNKNGLQSAGEQKGAPAASLPVEQDPFYSAFWQNVIAASSAVPPGQDPTWWTTHVLFELDDLVRYRHSSKLSPRKVEFARKLAPIYDSIRNIRTAYSILAYPHAGSYQRLLGQLIATDQRRSQNEDLPRTQIELNDTELGILNKLCNTPKYTFAGRDERGRTFDSPVKIIHPPIPFDPQKRIFRYSEIPTPKR